jgi:hypothetical protein
MESQDSDIDLINSWETRKPKEYELLQYEIT